MDTSTNQAESKKHELMALLNEHVYRGDYAYNKKIQEVLISLFSISTQDGIDSWVYLVNNYASEGRPQDFTEYMVSLLNINFGTEWLINTLENNQLLQETLFVESLEVPFCFFEILIENDNRALLRK